MLISSDVNLHPALVQMRVTSVAYTHLFGDLNDTFEECSYGEQLYCANGIDYYICLLYTSRCV